MYGIAGGLNAELGQIRDLMAGMPGLDSGSDVRPSGAAILGIRRLVPWAPWRRVAAPARDVAAVWAGEVFPAPPDDFPLAFRADPPALNRVNGTFACATWDGTAITLLRDFPGQCSLYYAVQDRTLLFSSHRSPLARLGLPVQEVPAGTWVRSDGRQVTQGRWFSVAPQSPSADPVEALDRLLADAVRLRCSPGSGLQVGVLLSGGVDSSLIAALASRYVPVRALTYDGQDTATARQVAEYLRIPITVVPAATQAELHDLGTLARAELGPPQFFSDIVQSLFGVTYRLLAAGKEVGIQVLLVGDGSDELFAGYEFMRKNLPIMNQVIARMLEFYPDFASNRLEYLCALHGVAARAPFLDTRIVQWALSQPPDVKVRNGQDKWAVRQVARRYLPAEVADRPKAPLQLSTQVHNLFFGHPVTW